MILYLADDAASRSYVRCARVKRGLSRWSPPPLPPSQPFRSTLHERPTRCAHIAQSRATTPPAPASTAGHADAEPPGRVLRHGQLLQSRCAGYPRRVPQAFREADTGW